MNGIIEIEKMNDEKNGIKYFIIRYSLNFSTYDSIVETTVISV